MVKQVLRAGWQDATRSQEAFCGPRFLGAPSKLLRVLLFHAVNHPGLRETLTWPRKSKIAEMLNLALPKRLRTVAGDWLAWIAPESCRRFPSRHPCRRGYACNWSTARRCKGQQGAQWRVDDTVDLVT